ncbi:hypothetical protein [Acinetobacter baumannii]|uniref:hypothetical protein n=1 Tax=Acinetobacter baumannii TaxID=470 RepID=UPI003A8987C5
MLNILLIIVILLLGYYTKKSRDEIKSLYRQLELNDERIRDLLLKNITKLENADKGLTERCSGLHKRVFDLEQVCIKDHNENLD